MIVICLEGCHGCGKSTLTSLFSKSGFMSLDEAFLSMPHYNCMSPQTMLMESIWIGNWFSRLLDHRVASGNGSSEEEVFIADRSPFSAVCYAGDKGHLLDPVIRAQMEEVRDNAGIEIYSVHLEVEDETLWRRIQTRLVVEPGREELNEGEREHMDRIHGWYKAFDWDFVVDNTGEGGGEEVMAAILERVMLRSRKAREEREGGGDRKRGGECGSPTSVAIEWTIE
ncbi:hypothetical protein TrCOL_g5429 [Triparma columacea]|uniref:NadR/Ttd14 AAA domain-containing protein n=1 Tax=Triparma columacea TaxID=722753 RepID=A0A9W7LEK9_9STRA|nr:hypothetical protein TrCOL_g5429 [Triparma columacea]